MSLLLTPPFEVRALGNALNKSHAAREEMRTTGRVKGASNIRMPQKGEGNLILDHSEGVRARIEITPRPGWGSQHQGFATLSRWES